MLSQSKDQSPHLGYRPDIDGLRAFAVISVVVFHAFPTFLPGGFVGVDVFFVISGFLISGIMFDALQAGEFSFSDFYARRVKRIFPALTLVLLLSLAFAWFVLFSDEFKQLGNHVSRAALFLSNFILWHESGYFDTVAEMKPLLHLWSLGIEEQFYIAWPLVVWVLWRMKIRLGWMIFCVGTLSFFWNIYQSQHDQVHDFYSPLTRFWELLSGSLLAFSQRSSATGSLLVRECWSRVRDQRSAIGFGMLVLAIMVTDARNFPGAWALLPVVGSVLVISSPSQAWINRVVFSNPVCVWVGTISYPLYLWHWPIFSFSRIVEGATPSAMWRCIALGLSLLLAWLTFVWVEKPLRFGWRFRYKTVTLVMAMVAIGAMGYAVRKADGYPSRSLMNDSQAMLVGDVGHDEFHEYLKAHFSPCADSIIQAEAESWKGMTRCFQSKPLAKVDVVLIGDSHAEHLFLGLAEALPQKNVAFYIKSALPMLSHSEFQTVFNHVLNSADIQTVLIAADWTGRLKEPSVREHFVESFDETLLALLKSGKRIYVMVDTPKFDFDPQRCKFQRAFTQSTLCEEPLERYVEQRENYLPLLKSAVRPYEGISVIDPSAWICGDAVCSMAIHGQLLYRDNNHLSILGSKYVAEQIIRKIPNFASAAK